MNMVFATASAVPRPVRLKEATREWAFASLHGKYGDEALRNACVHLDGDADFEALSELQKYDRAVRRSPKKRRYASVPKSGSAAPRPWATRYTMSFRPNIRDGISALP